MYLDLILVIMIYSICVECDQKAYRRRKRYVAFPEGSTFSVTLCPTISAIASFGIYFEGINWGVAYTLPNRSSVEEYISKYKKQRRERRDLYSKIETIMDNMGFEGQTCIQRALCEASTKFRKKPKSLSEDLLRIFFKFPLQSLSSDEPEQHHIYHSAYRNGKVNVENDCADIYPQCAFSLIDLALGNYEIHNN